MYDVAEHVRSEVRHVFSGRRVVYAGGVLAAMTPLVNELRAANVERMLLLPSGVGTGPLPEGDDIEVVLHELPPTPHATAQFRMEEQLFADPPPEFIAAMRSFAGDVDPLVLAPPFSAVRMVGPYPVYGPRRAEWVALEDKTLCDALFDEAGVPRPPSRVVAVEAGAIDDACAQLDRGAGTVWAGDARGGFNGGGEYVRWVCDARARAAALDFFTTRCDRVRIAPFVDGVPCSIHGFVTAAGVAAFRPVELVTLRVPDPRGLRFAGAATYFDPPGDDRETMRAAVRAMGARLRERVDFRGGVTIDGISGPDGWVATECNPRQGGALAYTRACVPDLLFELTQRVVAAGGLDDLDLEAFEHVIVTAADSLRWGGAWTPTSTVFSETTTIEIVGDEQGYRGARDGEVADATITTGPGGPGGFVRFTPGAARTPAGPSIALRAVAAFAFADAELGTALGPFAPALSVR